MGISIWQLLIILAIVVVLFGTKKLRNIGEDLGSAIKSFKQSLNGEEDGAGSNRHASEKPSSEERIGDSNDPVFDAGMSKEDRDRAKEKEEV